VQVLCAWRAGRPPLRRDSLGIHNGHSGGRLNDRYVCSNWSIEVPPDWAIDEAPECVGFVPPDKTGALQLSAYSQPTGEVSLEELRRSAAKYADQLAAYSTGDLGGFSASVVRDDTFSRYWWLASGRYHFFVTWNVATKDRLLHADTVDALVRSLKLVRL
jgi:hypothetical protein